MKYDRSTLVVLGSTFISLVVAVVAIVMVLRAATGPTAAEMTELRDRVEALEGEIETLRERESEGGEKVKDVFSVAAVEEQMKKLRAEIDDLKTRGGGQGGVAAAEEKQERILKDVNKAFHRTWKSLLDAKLGQNGFDDDQRQRIVGDYGKMLEGIEDVQTRWLKGDLDWSSTMDEIKMRSIEFYDAVERGADTDTARRVIDIAFPTPEMKKFFFSGSGQ